MEWRDLKGNKHASLRDRNMAFYSDPKLRTIDFQITLTAADDGTIGDPKEGCVCDPPSRQLD